MVYIKGVKASKKDTARLIDDIHKGKQTAKAHITKKGNIAVTTT